MIAGQSSTKIWKSYTITEEGEKSPSLGWKGERGFIDKAMLEKYLTKSELNHSTYYICSPPAMLNAMYKLLAKEVKVPDEKIKTEEFYGY